METDELEVLRAEAARFLERVQALEGLEDELRTVGPVPEAVANLPFWSLRRLARGEGITGRVLWRHWDEGEPPDETALKQLAAYRRAGYPVRVDQADGSTLWRLPEYIPAPVDEARDQAEGYRQAVLRFADSYLLNAQWAASAVHDALREDRPIALPPNSSRQHLPADPRVRPA